MQSWGLVRVMLLYTLRTGDITPWHHGWWTMWPLDKPRAREVLIFDVKLFACQPMRFVPYYLFWTFSAPV